jgi:PKD repeat protein
VTLAFDGSPATGTAASANSATAALTTSESDDVIVVWVDFTNTGVSVAISDAAGLTWNQRSQLQASTYGLGHTLTCFWAKAPNPLSADVITVDVGGSAVNISIVAYGVKGSPNPSSPWDPDASLPVYAQGPSSNAPSISGIATSEAASMVLAAFATRSTPTMTPQGSFVSSGAETGPPSVGTQYEIYASPTSGISSATHLSTAELWCGIGDALAGASTSLSVVPTVSPGQGNIPLAAEFTATPSGGSSPYTYAWDFGDGDTSTSQNPSHTYSTAGPFAASVVVTDSASHTASGTVIVWAGVVSYKFGGGSGGSASAGPISAPKGSSIYVIGLVGGGLGFLGAGCTDNRGNTYTPFDLPGSAAILAWYADNVNQSSNLTATITTTRPETVGGMWVIVVLNNPPTYGGLPPSDSSPDDAVLNGASSSTENWSVDAKGTPALPSELVIIAVSGTGNESGAPDGPITTNLGTVVDTEEYLQFSYNEEGGFDTVGALAALILGAVSPSPAGTFDAAGEVENITGSPTVTATLLSILRSAVQVAVEADPTGGPIPLTVDFTATPSYGYPPYTFAWTFGDGGTSTEQDPSYTYVTKGPYTAEVTVTDAVGNTATAQVTVTPGDAPAGPVILWRARVRPDGLAVSSKRGLATP